MSAFSPPDSKLIDDSFFPGGGMSIFSPDTVAGYPGDYQAPDFDRSWFSSNTIVARYKTMESLISDNYLLD